MTAPITPSEVISKGVIKPPYVIEAFNNMIQEKWNGTVARFTQDEIVEKLIPLVDLNLPDAHNLMDNEKCNRQRDKIFNDKLLDVEPIFRDAGWTVIFDKPAYNESYSSTFEFKKP